MIKDNYYIAEIDYRTAMDVVVKNHYLHRKCPCSHAFGLFDYATDKLVGVVVYGVSCSSTLLKGICGEDEMHNVYELNRLWVSDDVPKKRREFFNSEHYKTA